MNESEYIGNDLLNEFHLDTGQLPLQDRYNIVREIYLSVLREDELWHFFYEAEVGDIVRCSPQYSKNLKSWLLYNYPDLNYRWNAFWVEEMQEVINNPEYFANLFNLNSEFIIERALKFSPNDKSESMAYFVDRFSHSLFLNEGFCTGKFEFGEAEMIQRVATGRSFYEGRRYQYLATKGYNRDNNGNQSNQ